MKRFVLAFLLALPIFLMMGCELEGPPSVSAQTQVVASLTVAAYTPTFVPTRHPHEIHIVELINAGLQELEDPLSRTVDASYTVIQAPLKIRLGQIDPSILSIEVRCQCANNGSCCNVEHTFVMIAKAMALKRSEIVGWVPPTVVDFEILCYDHQSQIGIMSTNWVLMQGYIFGQIDGYQLGGAVQNPTPTP